MMMDQAIELVAEAIWSAGWDIKPGNVQWADVRDPIRAKYMRMAWAATNMAIEVIRLDSEESQVQEGYDDCPVCQRAGQHCGGEHK